MDLLQVCVSCLVHFTLQQCETSYYGVVANDTTDHIDRHFRMIQIPITSGEICSQARGMLWGSLQQVVTCHDTNVNWHLGLLETFHR